MKALLRTLAVFFIVLATAPVSRAAETEVTTYYDAPYADYKHLHLQNSLTVGAADADPGPLTVAGNPYTLVSYGSINIRGNLLNGAQAGASGGRLTVTGALDVEDAAGNPLLYVDAANNRIGIGTRNPLATLDVRGHAKAMSFFAYTNPMDNRDGYAELYCEGNLLKFASTYYNPAMFRLRYGTLHLDGAPLALQTVIKNVGADVPRAGGRGQVVIRGRFSGYESVGNNVILVVGEPKAGQDLAPDPNQFWGVDQGDWPAGTPPQDLPGAYAHDWYQFSSASFKKDIMPLDASQEAALLSKLDTSNVVRFRYRDDPSAHRARLGFIAEEAPDDFVDVDRRSVGLGDEAAFLLASAKALAAEQAQLKERLERLKK